MKYVLRKLLTFILTLFLVSLLTFFAFNIIPGDPAQMILGTSASPQQLAVLRGQLGLNDPMPIRYGRWLAGFFSGNLGKSIKYSVPVRGLIANRLPVTAILAGITLFLIILLSIPIGICCAKRKDTIVDKLLGTLTMMNISIPNFFLGIIFIWLFGIVLKCFTPGGYVDFMTNPTGFLIYMFFPALAIALPNIATVIKFLRTSVISQLKLDYVRTAYSKGNRDNAVLYRHVLKNALVPVITLFGMILSEVFSGSIIIEQVFGIPGVGRLLITSISSRDFPLVESLVVYIAAIVVIANFWVDILLQAIDPRIRIHGAQ
ncbi:MAG: ABC transporter permease [Ethanoligenens sp.]